MSIVESCSHPFQGVQAQTECDRNTKEWHVSSRDYFSLEQKWQQCIAQRRDLKSDYDEQKLIAEAAKADAKRREADAVQRAAQEASQLYGPQLAKAQGDVQTLEAQLRTLQDITDAQRAEALKDIQLLHGRVADLSSQHNTAQDKLRISQLALQQAHAARGRAEKLAESSKREADCWRAQLDVAAIERHRLYRNSGTSGITPAPDDSHIKELEDKVQALQALRAVVTGLRNENQGLQARCKAAEKAQQEAARELEYLEDATVWEVTAGSSRIIGDTADVRGSALSSLIYQAAGIAVTSEAIASVSAAEAVGSRCRKRCARIVIWQESAPVAELAKIGCFPSKQQRGSFKTATQPLIRSVDDADGSNNAGPFSGPELVARGRASISDWSGRLNVAADLLALPQEAQPAQKQHHGTSADAGAEAAAPAFYAPDVTARPPASPGFWNDYGKLPEEPAEPPEVELPAVSLDNRCTIDGKEESPTVKPLQPRTAKAVFGISSHVLALLQQSGTSPEALAELAGITAPAPCKPGQQSSGRKDLSTGSTRWDVEPAVCWAGVCGGHKPRASLADQLEGRSQLPFSEQQTSSTLGGGRLRESLEAEMDHMQDEDPERRRRSTDGPRPEGPFKEIVTVAHTGSGPGLVQDSPWRTESSSEDTMTADSIPESSGSNWGSGGGFRRSRLATHDSLDSPYGLQQNSSGNESHYSTGGSLHSLGSVRETHSLNVDSFKGATFVNQYIVIKTLGMGAYGKVKLALDSKDHHLYAIKLINKSRVRRRTRLTRTRSYESKAQQSIDDDVLREIFVMKQLSHPNIVQLVEVIDDPQGSKLLMVLEYVEGGPVLGGRGSEKTWKPVSEPVARTYFRDIVQGLDYLHANRIVHGDCKPDNLLLGADGHVKISDFGSSRMLGGGDAAMMLRAVGTPAFLAPEVCAGLPYHGRCADLWALGICLYCFIYGTVPFKADSILALYDDIRTAPLEFPATPYASIHLQDLLQRMLEKDPAHRIDMQGIMAHGWLNPAGVAPLKSLQSNDAGPRLSVAAVTRKSLQLTENANRETMRGLVQLVTSLFEQRRFRKGDLLARQGTPATTMFYLQEGTCEIVHDLHAGDADEDFVEDSDSFTERSDGPHGRQPRMLATMLDATQRAVQHVEPARKTAEEGMVVTTRGPGQFIGEVNLLEPGSNSVRQMWRTSVRAQTKVAVLLLTQAGLKTLLLRAPQAEAQVRAAMAQRRSELLKLETLERIAAFHSDLTALAGPQQSREPVSS